MTSQGFGGAGSGPHGGTGGDQPWSSQQPQHGGAPYGGQQHGGEQHSGQSWSNQQPQQPQYGNHPQQGGQSPYGQQHYGQPVPPSGYGPSPVTGPGSPSFGGPTGPGQAPPPKRPWALMLVAFGCIGALVVGIGLGVGFLALGNRGEEQTAGPSRSETPNDSETPTDSGSPTDEPTESESPTSGSGFRVVSPIDLPPGNAEQLWAVMNDNPLTTGTLPAIRDCELPATPVEHTDEELQVVLDAAGSCLNHVWVTASSDRSLPWISPTIQVYTWPDIPNSECAADTFEEDFPRVCNLNNTIYWPSGYGTATENTDPALVAPNYLWDLSYLYMIAVAWHSSLGVYYTTLSGELESDPDRQAEAWRRYNLQMVCLSSAASMRVPEATRPNQALQDRFTDESNWTEGEPPRTLQPSSRVLWVGRGLASEGDVSQCNTWDAPADQVA